MISKDERGFVADHQGLRGNPQDAGLLVPSLQRVMAVTGRPPGTVVADRGFGTAANDRAVAALGCPGSGCNATAPCADPGTSWSTPAGSAGCAPGGRESRPASASSKRGFGLRRTRLRRLSGARTWVGLGVFADNLQRMTVIA